MNENKKNIKPILIIILIVTYLILSYTVSLEITDYIKAKDRSIEENNNENKTNIRNDIRNITLNDNEKINLKLRNDSYDINIDYDLNLRLEKSAINNFYKAEIFAKSMKIKNYRKSANEDDKESIFSERDSHAISESTDDAFNFSIVKMDDYYFLISNINSNEEIKDKGKYIVVISPRLEIIGEFRDVGYDISTTNHTLTITKCLELLDNKCVKTIYQLDKNNNPFYLSILNIENEITQEEVKTFFNKLDEEKLNLSSSKEEYEINYEVPYPSSGTADAGRNKCKYESSYIVSINKGEEKNKLYISNTGTNTYIQNKDNIKKIIE